MEKSVITSIILKIAQKAFAWIKNVNLDIPKSVETLKIASFSKRMLACTSISYQTKKILKIVLNV